MPDRSRPVPVAAGAWLVAGAAALLVLGAAGRYGSFVAGGADSSGYLSQARLWASGRPTVPVPLALNVPWRDAESTFAPLGYRPGIRRGTIVPTYAPGLPLTMALAAKIAGGVGPFVVVPILGALAVWLTFLLGRAVGGPGTGAAGAVLTATSPIFLFQVIQPMSDVPVTAWWLASLVLVVRRGRWSALLAGCCAGGALLTRPNLVPLLLPILVFLAAHRSWRRLALFIGGVVPAAAAVGLLNAHLYGSPLVSGYGSLSDIYDSRNLVPNLWRYWRWALDTLGWVPALAPAAPAVLWLGQERANPADGPRPAAVSWLLLGVAAANVLCYLFYLRFNDWSYLRFLLPSVPLVLLLACSVAVSLARRLPAWLAVPLLVVAVGAVAAGSVQEAQRKGVFATARHERRYVEVAEFVSANLPARALLVTMQHSGSLPYYTGLPILRWDQLERGSLDFALLVLRQKGLRPYLVLERWEERDFRDRLPAGAPLASLDWPPLFQSSNGEVRLFAVPE